jgi:hypothetical protein
MVSWRQWIPRWVINKVKDELMLLLTNFRIQENARFLGYKIYATKDEEKLFVDYGYYLLTKRISTRLDNVLVIVVLKVSLRWWKAEKWAWIVSSSGKRLYNVYPYDREFESFDVLWDQLLDFRISSHWELLAKA